MRERAPTYVPAILLANLVDQIRLTRPRPMPELCADNPDAVAELRRLVKVIAATNPRFSDGHLMTMNADYVNARDYLKAIDAGEPEVPLRYPYRLKDWPAEQRQGRSRSLH
jgi:hypothetical protein